MIEHEATLRICSDCWAFAHYGFAEPENFFEGYGGPTDETLLRCHFAEYDECQCDWELGECEGHWHFSKFPCEGCGDGLAGDRAAVRIWTLKRKGEA